MKKKLLLLPVLSLTLMAFASCGDTSADTVIKGTIYTADKDDSVVEAVAVKDGKFTYVGDAAGVESFTGENTEVIETGDGIAMPSFVEAHSHGVDGLADLYEVMLYEDENIKGYQKTISQFIKDNPDKDFIYGAGWINGNFPNNTPTAKLLDSVSKDLPIVTMSEDGHSYWANSKAMEMAKVNKNTKDVKGGVISRDKAGNPTGCFREDAMALMDKIIPEYSVEQYKEGILAYQDEIISYGTTAYMEAIVNIDEAENALTAYKELDKDGKLLTRVYAAYEIDDAEGYLDEVDKVADLVKETKGNDFQVTSIKIFVDGVVEGHTAYLLDDYADSPGDRDKPLWDQDHLNQLVAKADSLGVQVHTHAIGDAALRMIVDACEFAKEKNGDTDLRHGVTHLQVADPSDIKRMADLNMVAAPDPYWFCKEPGYFYEIETPYLGKERADKEYPMKDFFDAGVVTNVASDYSVTWPPRPLDAIQTGVTRMDLDANKSTLLGPDQRVTVLQMMRAATFNGAYSYFGDEEYGSIEEGKSADYLLLDQNIMDIDPTKIGKTTILKTVFKGKSIYEAKAE